VIRGLVLAAWMSVDALLAQVPEGLEAPVRQNSVELRYPDSLRARDPPVAGEVRVRMRIGVDGVPKAIEVVQGLDPAIDAAVVEAVAGLRYSPARLRGQPVEIQTTITISVAPPPEDAPRPPEPEPEPEPEPVPGPEPVPQTPPREPSREDPVAAQTTSGTASLRGTVLRAGDRVPMPEAVVAVAQAGSDPPAWTREVLTNAKGGFELEDLPEGEVTVVVTSAGHEPRTYRETLAAAQELEVRYFVQPEGVYRTVVRSGDPWREEVGRRTVSMEEVKALPGNQGDPLRALQALPGLSRPPFGAGLLVVRGAAPFDTAVLVDEHVITFLFHFGALSTALPPELLEDIEFVPGNFDARYGNHLGGVIRVNPREGRRDGFHGHVELDLLDTGFHVEGPMGRGSFIVAARRSVADVVLPYVIPQDAGLHFVQVPRYYDYQAILTHPVGRGTFTVRGFGADDRFEFVQAPPNDEVDVRDQRSTAALFHRGDLVYERDVGRIRVFASPSYRFERADLTNGEAYRFDIARHVLSGRLDVTAKVSSNAVLELGNETIATWSQIVGEAPRDFDFGVTGDPGRDATVRTESQEFKAFTAFYAAATVRLGARWSLTPGVRWTWYDRPMKRLIIDPRLRAAVKLGKGALKAAVGLYAQEPTVNQQSAVFGNPDLAVERGLHTSAEFVHPFPHEIELSVGGFYKYLWDRVAPSADAYLDGELPYAEQQANTRDGWVYGAELLLKKNPGPLPVVGWLSYTFTMSVLRDREGAPTYAADLVQRHVINAVVGVALPHRFRLGARLTVTSGAPYAPVHGGVFDASSGSYVPVEGARNSAFLPWFHQVSVRLEKTWLWNWASATAYLDLQNVYNHPPVEAYAYGYDYRTKAKVGGLPIVPWAGVRFDF